MRCERSQFFVNSLTAWCKHPGVSRMNCMHCSSPRTVCFFATLFVHLECAAHRARATAQQHNQRPWPRANAWSAGPSLSFSSSAPVFVRSPWPRMPRSVLRPLGATSAKERVSRASPTGAHSRVRRACAVHISVEKLTASSSTRCPTPRCSPVSLMPCRWTRCASAAAQISRRRRSRRTHPQRRHRLRLSWRSHATAASS